MLSSKYGVLVVFSGPSGAGKGTALAVAQKKHDGLKISVSATTRQPRVGEVDGVNYYFKTVAEFEKSVARGEFLEHKNVFGNYYGTPKAPAIEQLEKGNDVVLEIDVEGAYEVKKVMPEAVLVFFTPASASETERRLRGRKTDSDDVIARRLQEAKREVAGAVNFDYFIVSTTPEESADILLSILTAEKTRVARHVGVIEGY